MVLFATFSFMFALCRLSTIKMHTNSLVIFVLLNAYTHLQILLCYDKYLHPNMRQHFVNLPFLFIYFHLLFLLFSAIYINKLAHSLVMAVWNTIPCFYFSNVNNISRIRIHVFIHLYYTLYIIHLFPLRLTDLHELNFLLIPQGFSAYDARGIMHVQRFT